MKEGQRLEGCGMSFFEELIRKKFKRYGLFSKENGLICIKKFTYFQAQDRETECFMCFGVSHCNHVYANGSMVLFRKAASKSAQHP